AQLLKCGERWRHALMAIRIGWCRRIMIEAPEIQSRSKQAESDPANGKLSPRCRFQNSRCKQDHWKSDQPDQIPMNKAVIPREGAQCRQPKFPPRPDRQEQSTDAKSEERVREKIGKLHRPEPIMKLDRREQSDVRKKPRRPNAKTLPVQPD